MKELKKAILKKILSFTVAGTMLGATVGLSGCSTEAKQYDISSEKQHSYLVDKNVYIVVSQNEIDTLHRGDVIVPYDSYGDGFTYVFPTVLKLNCGKELKTYQFVAYPQSCPTPEEYDKVCDCAYQLKPQSQVEENKNNATNCQSKTTSKDERCL